MYFWNTVRTKSKVMCIEMRKSIIFLLVAACLNGCSNDSGGRVPAVGHVTLDGAPLGDVYVTFRPDDGQPGNGGYAVTDSEGRFEIYYPDTGKGLVPARYKVTITEPPQDVNDVTRPAANLAQKTARSSRYPPIYSSPENTPLRVEVVAEGAQLKVELSSRPGKS